MAATIGGFCVCFFVLILIGLIFVGISAVGQFILEDVGVILEDVGGMRWSRFTRLRVMDFFWLALVVALLARDKVREDKYLKTQKHHQQNYEAMTENAASTANWLYDNYASLRGRIERLECDELEVSDRDNLVSGVDSESQ